MSRTQKEQAHNSLTSRGSFAKNSSWQASQSVVHITVTVYGNRLNLARKELAVASQHRTVTRFPFHKIFFGQKHHDCPPYFSLFP
jgi:hypothetical protein